MPILTVELVGPNPPAEGLARTLADAAGRVFGSEPATTWVKLHWLDAAFYGENDSACSVQPVFVDLLLADPPEGQALQQLLARLTDAVAAVIGCPAEQVHVLLQPPAAGRISFGGRLRE